MASTIKIKIGADEYTITGAASEDTLKNIEKMLGASFKNGGTLDPKIIKSINDNLKDLNDNSNNLDESFDDLAESTGKVDDSFDTLVKNQQKREADRNKAIKDFIGSAKSNAAQFSTVFKGNLSQLTSRLTKEFVGEGSVQDYISQLGRTIDTTIDIVTEFGKSLVELVPKIGTALGGLTQGVADALKFVNDTMMQELQKVIKSYETLTNSGGILSGGITELASYANQAGVGISTFADAMSKNSKYIQDTGLGMTAGAKVFGSVVGQLVTSTGQYSHKLFELGFSFSDQAEIVAATMGNLSRTTDIQRISTEEIAKESFDYAKSLRIISDITGKTAQQQMEEQRNADMNIAVQNKLQTMGADAQKRFNSVLSSLPDQMKVPFEQLLVFGTVIDKQGAVLSAQLPGYSAALQKSVGMVNDTTLSATDAGKQAQLAVAGMRDNMLNNPTLNALSQANLAGVGGDIASLGDATNKLYDATRNYTTDGIEAAYTAEQHLTTNTDQLTNQFASFNTQLLGMNNMMDKLLIPHLGQYSSILVTTGQKIQTAFGLALDAVDRWTKGLPILPPNSPGGNAVSTLSAIYNGPEALQQSPQEFASGMDAKYPWLAAIDKFFKSGDYAPSLPAYADGGIASGPTTGFNATLHGTEAIVPLPDGDSIPVTLQTTDNQTTASTERLENLVSALYDEQMRTNEMTNQLLKNAAMQTNLSKDLISVLEKNNLLLDKLLRNSY